MKTKGCTKAQVAATGGREEPPHVRGQGQKPGGPHDQRAVAKRSYPMSKVRGSGRQEIPSIRGQGQQREELPRIRGQGRWPEEIPHTPKPEARGGGREELPQVQGAVAMQAQEGLEELPF